MGELDERYQDLHAKYSRLGDEKDQPEAKYRELFRTHTAQTSDSIQARSEANAEIQSALKDSLASMTAKAAMGEKVESLEREVKGLQAALEAANSDLAKTRLAKQGAEEALNLTRASLDKTSADLSELDSHKQTAMLGLSKALSAKQCALSRLDQVQRENGQLSDDLSGARADAGVAANVAEECRSRVADLEAKVRRQRLRTRKRRLRTQRLKRDVGCLREWQGELQGQVNAAVALIRLVFIGSKSRVWKRVIDRIIEAPSIEVPGIGRSWDVWRTLPPYSNMEGFRLLPGDYDIHGLGLELVASLDTESLESHLPSLLGRLCAFQGILGTEDIECLGCMVDMLLEAFAETIDDPRLHLLHRLVMYQVSLLLGSQWARGEAVRRITRILIRADERAHTVVMMLTDSLEDGIQALLGRQDQRLSLIFYEAHDLLLVGFREHVGGILAIEMQSRTLRWIGFECIRWHPCQLTISFNGEEKRLMLDSVSHLFWVLESLPSVENRV